MVVEDSQGTLVEDDDDDDDSMDGYEEDDQDVFGLKTLSTRHSTMTPALIKALRRDFQGLLKAKFRPGHSVLAEGSHVVCMTVPIQHLGVSAKLLNAWDNRLLGSRTRLVLLLASSTYPITANSELRFQVGLSQKGKPSKEAIGVAFRQQSQRWTPGEFEHFTLR
jgi:hypothetical protein